MTSLPVLYPWNLLFLPNLHYSSNLYQTWYGYVVWPRKSHELLSLSIGTRAAAILDAILFLSVHNTGTKKYFYDDLYLWNRMADWLNFRYGVSFYEKWDHDNINLIKPLPVWWRHFLFDCISSCFYFLLYISWTTSPIDFIFGMVIAFIVMVISSYCLLTSLPVGDVISCFYILPHICGAASPITLFLVWL